MLVIKLKPFIEVDGIKQIAATWQIATDQEFTHIVENIKSAKYLNTYTSDIVIPEGLVYWVRAKRHFNQPNMDYFTEPAKILANDSEIVNMVLDKEIVIDEPTIYVNQEELEDHSSKTFTVRTSSFRSNSDGHKASHWFVRTNSGDLLFTKLDDTENKTSITITKTPEMEVESELVVSCIHIGTSGVESKIGTQIIRTVGFQYKILTPLSEVQPYVDLFIKFGSKREDGQTKIIKVTATDVSTGDVVLNSALGISNTVMIPWDRIKFNSRFYLDIHCYDNNGIYVVSRHSITTRSGFLTPIENVNITYKDTIEKTKDMNLRTAAGVSTIELPSGQVPYIKNNDVNVYGYTIDHNTGYLKSSITPLNGVSIVQPNPEYINFKYTNDDILIIDTMETDQEGKKYAVFLVYAYLRNKESYILTAKIKRKDEVRTTGFLNNFVQHTATDFFYVPYGKAELRRLDINKNIVTRVKALPNDKFINANLVWLPSNKILVAGTTRYTQVYDIEKKTFLSSIGMPDAFINTFRKQILLPNGDTLFIKAEDNVNDTGDKIMKFDYKTKSFSTVKYEIPYGMLPTSQCLCVDNRVIYSKEIKEDKVESLKLSAGITTPGWYGYIYS